MGYKKEIFHWIGSFKPEDFTKRQKGLTQLCPRCHAAIADDAAACPHCRLRFKTAAKAGRMALIIPGGGYFYAGNTLYGIATAILELLFAILSVIAAMDINEGLKGSPLILIVLAMAWIMVKTVSFLHSRDLAQGCFPAEGRLLPLRTTSAARLRQHL